MVTERGEGKKKNIERVRDKAGHAKKGKERETSSRTDNFYFGLVVNSAWLSDKSTTQWRCVCVWRGQGEVMEGERLI